MDYKKRILLVNEFSLLATGFSVIGHAILKRLHDTGKYEIAELASYISEDDQRIHELPWKVYTAQPSQHDKIALDNFHKNYVENQFGALRFNDVLLDFKPDIVFSWRDFWHDQFITRSPHRHLFYYIWSACVDSEPPKEEWLDVYSTVDCVTSYTQWGLNVLRKYGGDNLINISDIDTMPGVDIDIFRPMDKQKIREKYGIKDDAFIIMKCARNQMRKLYPDLIRSFMDLMDKLYKDGHDNIADHTFLYLHTSLTDVGFDIVQTIKRCHASHKVILTYQCSQCQHVFPSFLMGDIGYCRRCGQLSATTPNTSSGVSREILAEIYNLADLYVQLQIAGACEIPLLEAKASGLPTLAVNYAAPGELQLLPGSFGTIDVICYREESKRETEQMRGYPDCNDLIKKLYKFLRLDSEQRKKLEILSRETAEKYHNFDLAAKKWESLIDEVVILDHDRWVTKPQAIKIDLDNIPWNLPNTQFVRWCCRSLLPPKHVKRSFLNEKDLERQLNIGYKIENNKTRSFSKRELLSEIIKEVDNFNHFEMHRYNKLVLQPQNKIDNKVAYKIY